MKILRLKALFVSSLFTASLLAATFSYPRRVEASPAPMVFPVIGSSSYSDDYNAIHNGQIHHAIDIIAKKLTPIVAATDGVITHVNYPEPDWGWSVSIKDTKYYTYNYLHMNDDNPGSNDGKGGAMHAYAPDVKVGNPVVKGQLLGWVGDSGHANGVSHLHFEMYDPHNNVIDPYHWLQIAPHISKTIIPPQLPNEFLPYGTNNKLGANIAMGNFDVDPAQEMVTGMASGGSEVKIFDDNNTLLKKFNTFNPGFTGGVDVATGDVNGDSIDEIIVARGHTGGPRIQVYEPDGTLVADFVVYKPNYTGGLNVAAADVDGDALAEIIVGTKAIVPRVLVYKIDGTKFAEFNAYASSFRGGVDVAGGDITGTTTGEIVTAPGPGVTNPIKIWTGTGTFIRQFIPFGKNTTSGARVSVANVRTGLGSLKDEIAVVPALNGNPYIKLFDGNGSLLTSSMFIEAWWQGPYDVAAGNGLSKTAVGINRRTSIRPGVQ